MKLTFNTTDLATLGVLRIVGRSCTPEPADAPLRQRIAIRVRLDFFEQTFSANHNLASQLIAALQANTAVLDWSDEDGTRYENRTVTAGSAEMPRDVLDRGGTYWQAIEFGFWYYVAVSAAALTASYTPDTLPLQSLGQVESWTEKLTVERFDPLRDTRRRVTGTVTCSGKIMLDSTVALTTAQSAALAAKDALLQAMNNKPEGVLKYGTFTQTVRPTEFTAQVNQVRNWIAWTASFTFTRYPDESNYSLLEIRVGRRENLGDGIKHLNISGRIQAPSETAANTVLSSFLAATVPASYTLLSTDATPATVGSHSGSAGDGDVFTEIAFNYEYRDNGGLRCTLQRTGTNTPVWVMGTVDQFTVHNSTTLFDEQRSVRKRAAGTVTLSGYFSALESLPDATKQSQLAAALAVLQLDLLKGCSARLIYGVAFNQIVRLIDFTPRINKLRNRIDWSLTAHWTAFPNEADYAIAEIQAGTRENEVEGTVIKTLTGRIGAQSPEAAYAKLDRLRSTLIPAGYILMSSDPQERRVSSESNLTTPSSPQGDGDAFIEITVNDVWQKTLDGHVLEYSLRITTDKDARLPVVRISYSGMVRAAGADYATAYAAAAAQASALGSGKYPLQLRSNLVENQRLFQTTGGQVFVVLDFTYDYEAQTSQLYLEVRAELAVDNYGQTVQPVSGTIVTSSISEAEAIYQSNLRTLFGTRLVLQERRPTLSQKQLQQADHSMAALEDRYDFQLVLFIPKPTGQAAIRYDTNVTPDFRTLELTTQFQGTAWGATQAEAEALVQSVLSGLTLAGKKILDTRTPRFRTGPATVGGANLQVFESMDFNIAVVSLFTGVAGILECECSEDLLYSGNRNVERPNPAGASLIQQCGITLGTRTVTARCVATTRTAADTWVRGIRSALLASQNGTDATAVEDPPRVAARMTFLPQTAGVPTGDSANVRLFEISGTFVERIPELIFS